MNLYLCIYVDVPFIEYANLLEMNIWKSKISSLFEARCWQNVSHQSLSRLERCQETVGNCEKMNQVNDPYIK